jgi:hypothetical protein
MASIRLKKLINQSCRMPCSDVHQGQRVLNAGVDFVHLGQIIQFGLCQRKLVHLVHVDNLVHYGVFHI